MKERNKFICFAAGKGGVGKSVVSANIAYAASMLTEGKVVAVSADPGSKTLEYLVEGSFRPERGWVEFLNDPEAHITEVMIKSKLSENLFVVYSSMQRAFYSQSKAAVASAQLTKLMRQWNADPKTALIVVDTPAGRTRDHLVYASVFDAYLVTTHSRVDLKAAEEFRNVLNRRMFELFKVEEEVVRGVVANMVTSRGQVEEIRDYLDLPVLGAVPYSGRIEEANRKGLPIVALNPGDPASRALVEIAGKVLQVDASLATGASRARKGEKDVSAGSGLLESLRTRIRRIFV